MELEFDCGVIVASVGVLTMALRHHLTVCTDVACIADVNRELAKQSK